MVKNGNQILGNDQNTYQTVSAKQSCTQLKQIMIKNGHQTSGIVQNVARAMCLKI